MKIKRFVSCILSVLTMFSITSFVACKEESNSDSSKIKNEAPSKMVTLADFEQFNPDFQLLRLRQGFGAVNVNEEAEYVKSGAASAKLQPLGRYKDKAKPFFYFELESETYDYSYADLDYLYSVSMWLYNAQDEQKEVEIGVVTYTAGLDGVVNRDGEILYKLNSGWNKLTYFIDKSELYLPGGGSKARGIYLEFENIPSRDIEDAPVYYLDDVMVTLKTKFNEISVVEPSHCPNQGDVVTVPTATIQGGTVMSTVYYNNRQVAVSNNTFVAVEGGTYTVAYQAMVDGFLYKRNVEIFVKPTDTLEIIGFDKETDIANFYALGAVDGAVWMEAFEGETGIAKVIVNRDWPRFSFKTAHPMSAYANYEYVVVRMYVPTCKNQLTWINLCDAVNPIGYEGYLKADKWVTYVFPIEQFLKKWSDENAANGAAYFVGNSTDWINKGEFYISEIYAM